MAWLHLLASGGSPVLKSSVAPVFEDGLSVSVFKAVGKASSASGFGLNVGM